MRARSDTLWMFLRRPMLAHFSLIRFRISTSSRCHGDDHGIPGVPVIFAQMGERGACRQSFGDRDTCDAGHVVRSPGVRSRHNTPFFSHADAQIPNWCGGDRYILWLSGSGGCWSRSASFKECPSSCTMPDSTGSALCSSVSCPLSTGIGSFVSECLALRTRMHVSDLTRALGIYLLVLRYWLPTVTDSMQSAALLVRCGRERQSYQKIGVLMGYSIPDRHEALSSTR